MSRAIIGLMVLAPLALATAAPIPVHLMPKQPPLYFPTRVGAKWVYQGGEKQEWTFSVTAVEKTEAGAVVSVTQHRPDGRTFLDKKMLVSPAGVTQVETFEGKLASPWCWLKLGATTGERWESDCSTENFVQKWQCTVQGTEEIEVPAGKFTAVRVRSVLVSERRGGGPFPAIDISAVEWYAPGVGVVRVDRSVGAPSWKLKAFTP